MINRYSLADHRVVVTLPENFYIGSVNVGGKQIVFGGAGETGMEGSFMGQISITRNSEMFTTTGDVTGSWVHNKSLDRTGTVELQIRQISDDVVKLRMICMALEEAETQSDGILIEVYNNDDLVEKAEDCVIQKQVDDVLGESADNQTWTWLAGRVTFPQTTQL